MISSYSFNVGLMKIGEFCIVNFSNVCKPLSGFIKEGYNNALGPITLVIIEDKNNEPKNIVSNLWTGVISYPPMRATNTSNAHEIMPSRLRCNILRAKQRMIINIIKVKELYTLTIFTRFVEI